MQNMGPDLRHSVKPVLVVFAAMAVSFIGYFGSRQVTPDGLHQAMALNIDLAPTLLALAGVRVPSEMDGRSLVPLLADPGAAGRDHFLMEFWRYFPEPTPSYMGVVTKRHK